MEKYQTIIGITVFLSLYYRWWPRQDSNLGHYSSSHLSYGAVFYYRFLSMILTVPSRRSLMNIV